MEPVNSKSKSWSFSNFADLSLPNYSPKLDEKFSKCLFLSLAPLTGLMINGMKIENEKKKDSIQNCDRKPSLISPNTRKKNFSTPKRSIKGEFTVARNRSERTNFLGRKLANFDYKARLSARKLLNNYRRRKSYSASENLNHYHYNVIGDVTAEPNCKEAKGKKGATGKLGDSFCKKLCQLVILKALKLQSSEHLYFSRIPKFNPNSLFKLIWDLFVLILCLYCLLVYSIEKCFKTDLDLKLFNFLLMFLFYVDVGVKLNTKHFLDGVQIISRAMILRHYLWNYFFTDLIPSLGLSLIYFSSNEALYDANIFLCLRILRAPELGERFVEIVFKSERAESFYNLIILFLKIFACGHIIACLWHYTGYISSLKNPEENWLKHNGILEADWKTRYMFSIYWSVTTMLTVGYGDITPTNANEMSFNLFAMIVGCGVFGYSMNKIGEILRYGGKEERHIKNKMKKVDNLMHEKGIPSETQTKVKKYLEFVWKQEQKEDPEHEEHVMSKLSTNLRDEVYFHSNVKYLKTIKAFKTLSNETLIKLSTFMKKIRISPEEYLYREGDYEDLCVYFLIDGKVEITSEKENFKGKSKVHWKTIKKDECFGVQEIFTGQARRTNAFAIEFCSLFQLNRKDILKTLKKNPYEYEKFCLIRDLDIIYNMQSHYQIKCESCGYTDHITQECKFFRYEPNRLNVIWAHKLKKSENKLNVRQKRIRMLSCPRIKTSKS